MNLAALYDWLAERGDPPYPTTYFLEKPWKWSESWGSSISAGSQVSAVPPRNVRS